MDRTTFQALHAAGRLPSPKGVALELMRLIQRENVTTGEIATVIMSDPALTGRVVASANSASHYGHRPVISVAQAIAINGVAATSRLALGLSIIASHQNGHCRGFDYPRFWVGSVVAALAMQACAAQTRILAPAEAFTLGLLHRIGVLALATLHPEDYGELVAQAADPTVLVQQEQERYATDHRELGLYLLEEWGIPEVVRQAAAAADCDPALDRETATRTGKLTALLRVAGAMADAAGTGRLDPLRSPETVGGGRAERVCRGRSRRVLGRRRRRVADLGAHPRPRCRGAAAHRRDPSRSGAGGRAAGRGPGHADTGAARARAVRPGTVARATRRPARPA